MYSMYRMNKIYDNKKSLIAQTSLLRELFYLETPNEITQDEQAKIASSLQSVFTILLGQDREEFPEVFKGVRRLSLLPELVGSGYQKMALALINTCRTQLMYNINVSNSDNDYICRTVNYSQPEVLAALFEDGKLAGQMEDSRGASSIIVALSENTHEGVFAFSEKLDGSKFDKHRYINLLFMINNETQLDELYREKGEAFVLSYLIKDEGSFLSKIQHKKTLSLLFKDARLKERKILLKLLSAMPVSTMSLDILEMFIAHIFSFLPSEDIIDALGSSKCVFWENPTNALYILNELKAKSDKESVSLSDNPSVWSHSIDAVIRHNRPSAIVLYKWLIDNNVEIDNLGVSTDAVRMLREVYSMTPLQMIKSSDKKFEPFIKSLAKNCFSSTKQTPLGLMNSVDDWVKPHLLEYLAA